MKKFLVMWFHAGRQGARAFDRKTEAEEFIRTESKKYDLLIGPLPGEMTSNQAAIELTPATKKDHDPSGRW